MTTVRRHPLWLIAAAGLGLRLFLAFHWFGSGDILTFLLVGAEAKAHPLHIYATNVSGVFWPYPPGYLLWLVGAIRLSEGTGWPFQGVVQLLPILADLAIAVAVYVYLGWRGAAERARVGGFALVMLGPVFIAISGYHGQIDPVAILPGVLALMAWERSSQHTRAIAAGVLIGVGTVLKTVPMLLILPLLISARSVRDGARLVAAAVGLAVVVCLPFALAEPAGFRDVISYNGVPGRGGLSLLLDPKFGSDRRLSTTLALVGTPNGLSNWVSHAGGPITIVVLVVLAAFLWRYRPAPIDGIVVLWLAIYALSPNFLLQYLVWGLPFFIMAGYLREAALIQVAVIPALVLTYMDASVYGRAGADAYVALMISLWIFWVVALVVVVRRIVRRGAPDLRRSQRPLVELHPLAGSR